MANERGVLVLGAGLAAYLWLRNQPETLGEEPPPTELPPGEPPAEPPPYYTPPPTVPTPKYVYTPPPAPGIPAAVYGPSAPTPSVSYAMTSQQYVARYGDGYVVVFGGKVIKQFASQTEAENYYNSLVRGSVGGQGIAATGVTVPTGQLPVAGIVPPYATITARSNGGPVWTPPPAGQFNAGNFVAQSGSGYVVYAGGQQRGSVYSSLPAAQDAYNALQGYSGGLGSVIRAGMTGAIGSGAAGDWLPSTPGGFPQTGTGGLADTGFVPGERYVAQRPGGEFEVVVNGRVVGVYANQDQAEQYYNQQVGATAPSNGGGAGGGDNGNGNGGGDFIPGERYVAQQPGGQFEVVVDGAVVGVFSDQSQAEQYYNQQVGA